MNCRLWSTDRNYCWGMSLNLRHGTEENHEYLCCITEAIRGINLNCIFH